MRIILCAGTLPAMRRESGDPDVRLLFAVTVRRLP
jgi:hypothetical protein